MRFKVALYEKYTTMAAGVSNEGRRISILSLSFRRFLYLPQYVRYPAKLELFMEPADVFGQGFFIIAVEVRQYDGAALGFLFDIGDDIFPVGQRIHAPVDDTIAHGGVHAAYPFLAAARTTRQTGEPFDHVILAQRLMRGLFPLFDVILDLFIGHMQYAFMVHAVVAYLVPLFDGSLPDLRQCVQSAADHKKSAFDFIFLVTHPACP